MQNNYRNYSAHWRWPGDANNGVHQMMDESGDCICLAGAAAKGRVD